MDYHWVKKWCYIIGSSRYWGEIDEKHESSPTRWCPRIFLCRKTHKKRSDSIRKPKCKNQLNYRKLGPHLVYPVEKTWISNWYPNISSYVPMIFTFLVVESLASPDFLWNFHFNQSYSIPSWLRTNMFPIVMLIQFLDYDSFYPNICFVDSVLG